MSLSQLIVELSRRGIQLEAAGDRLRFSPVSAVTPELAQELRRHKQSILAIIQAPDVELAIAWQTALDELEAERKLSDELIDACRRATIQGSRGCGVRPD